MLYFNDIIALAGKTRKLNNQLRRGQCLFNALYDINPDVANNIRSTDSDCFYDDNKIETFFNELIKFGYI